MSENEEYAAWTQALDSVYPHRLPTVPLHDGDPYLFAGTRWPLTNLEFIRVG